VALNRQEVIVSTARIDEGAGIAMLTEDARCALDIDKCEQIARGNRFDTSIKK
jgi:hypothetical protein